MKETIVNITPETGIGQIAASHPLATRVFSRHKLDFCCGGGRAIGDVCLENGLDTNAVITEIAKELDSTVAEVRWDEKPVLELIDHISVAYHEPLWEELPRLEELALKVLDAHGEKEPEKFQEIADLVVAMRAELEEHMTKEEQILFPLVKEGRTNMTLGPIAVMMVEHDEAGDVLRRLRQLTNDYDVPAEACNTWRALWFGLNALEEALHEHIHLENNILFPRVLHCDNSRKEAFNL
ncbi:MAG: regulator of cell morphogenesis and NO signaling [Candidatus Krumholzibacteriia bacterium]|jgi:regulator of cell morphogenesis and NO signaling